MITFPEVSDWFLREARQVFSPYALQRVDGLRYANESQSKYLLEELRYYVDHRDCINDRGEILTLCAAYYYQFGEFSCAETLLLSALHVFEHKMDYRNQAFVCCMLHHLFCAKNDRVNTFLYTHRALSSFLHCGMTLATEVDRKYECIYMDWANDIAYDLLCNPEDTFEVINEFCQSEFTHSSRCMRRDIDALLRQNRMDEIKQIINLLLENTRHSQQHQETAEALAYAALIIGKIGDISQAIKWVKQAICSYLPSGHEGSFSRWMLALYQLQTIDQYGQAVKNIELCISSLEDLRIAADHHRILYQKLWYEAFIHGMHQVLENRMRHHQIRRSITPPALLTVEPPANPPNLVQQKQPETQLGGDESSGGINVIVTVNFNGRSA